MPTLQLQGDYDGHWDKPEGRVTCYQIMGHEQASRPDVHPIERRRTLSGLHPTQRLAAEQSVAWILIANPSLDFRTRSGGSLTLSSGLEFWFWSRTTWDWCEPGGPAHISLHRKAIMTAGPLCDEFESIEPELCSTKLRHCCLQKPAWRPSRRPSRGALFVGSELALHVVPPSDPEGDAPRISWFVPRGRLDDVGLIRNIDRESLTRASRPPTVLDGWLMSSSPLFPA